MLVVGLATVLAAGLATVLVAELVAGLAVVLVVVDVVDIAARGVLFVNADATGDEENGRWTFRLAEAVPLEHGDVNRDAMPRRAAILRCA